MQIHCIVQFNTLVFLYIHSFILSIHLIIHSFCVSLLSLVLYSLYLIALFLLLSSLFFHSFILLMSLTGEGFPDATSRGVPRVVTRGPRKLAGHGGKQVEEDVRHQSVEVQIEQACYCHRCDPHTCQTTYTLCTSPFSVIYIGRFTFTLHQVMLRITYISTLHVIP